MWSGLHFIKLPFAWNIEIDYIRLHMGRPRARPPTWKDWKNTSCGKREEQSLMSSSAGQMTNRAKKYIFIQNIYTFITIINKLQYISGKLGRRRKTT